MRAAKDDAVDRLLRYARKPFFQIVAQGCRTNLAALDEFHDLRARQLDDLPCIFESLHETCKLLLPERRMRRHDDDARLFTAQDCRLQRRLHTDDRHLSVSSAQRRTGGTRRRITGKHDGFDPLCRHAVDLRRRQGANLSLRSLAIRRMGGIAKINEILLRQKGNQLAQHADAAES